MNPLERIHEQRAQRLLDALQSDLRAQMRLESSEGGGGRRSAQENARVRMKKRLQRLADPHNRERVWNPTVLPEYDGRAVQSLPKTRAFWEHIDDLASWSKAALDAACQLLDLDDPSGGSSSATTGAGNKKMELVARIQDWIHEPELRAKREEHARLSKQRDALLGAPRAHSIVIEWRSYKRTRRLTRCHCGRGVGVGCNPQRRDACLHSATTSAASSVLVIARTASVRLRSRACAGVASRLSSRYVQPKNVTCCLTLTRACNVLWYVRCQGL